MSSGGMMSSPFTLFREQDVRDRDSASLVEALGNMLLDATYSFELLKRDVERISRDVGDVVNDPVSIFEGVDGIGGGLEPHAFLGTDHTGLSVVGIASGEALVYDGTNVVNKPVILQDPAVNIWSTNTSLELLSGADILFRNRTGTTVTEATSGSFISWAYKAGSYMYEATFGWHNDALRLTRRFPYTSPFMFDPAAANYQIVITSGLYNGMTIETNSSGAVALAGSSIQSAHPNISIGYAAAALNGGIAIGKESRAEMGSVALGQSTILGGTLASAGSVAIGASAAVDTSGVGVGRDLWAGERAVAIGAATRADENGICVGYDSIAYTDCITIGYDITTPTGYDIYIKSAKTSGSKCNIDSDLHERGNRVVTSGGITGSGTTPVGTVRVEINGDTYNLLYAV